MYSLNGGAPRAMPSYVIPSTAPKSATAVGASSSVPFFSTYCKSIALFLILLCAIIVSTVVSLVVVTHHRNPDHSTVSPFSTISGESRPTPPSASKGSTSLVQSAATKIATTSTNSNGICYTWTVHPNTLLLSGVSVPNVDTLAACQDYCIRNAQCVALSCDHSVYVAYQCFIYIDASTLEEFYQASATDLFILNRTVCPESTTTKPFYVSSTTKFVPSHQTTPVLTTSNNNNVCEEVADLVFILDGSDTVNTYNDRNWVTMLQLVTRVIDRFRIGENFARVSVITFNDEAHVTILLDQYYNANALKQALLAIPYPGGGANFSNPLRAMLDEVLQANVGGGRPYSRQICYFFTGGAVDHDPSETMHQAIRALQQNVYIIGVGLVSNVGQEDIVRSQMSQFVSNPDEILTIIPSDAQNLNLAADKLVEISCPVMVNNPGTTPVSTSVNPRTGGCPSWYMYSDLSVEYSKYVLLSADSVQDCQASCAADDEEYCVGIEWRTRDIDKCFIIVKKSFGYTILNTPGTNLYFIDRYCPPTGSSTSSVRPIP